MCGCCHVPSSYLGSGRDKLIKIIQTFPSNNNINIEWVRQSERGKEKNWIKFIILIYKLMNSKFYSPKTHSILVCKLKKICNLWIVSLHICNLRAITSVDVKLCKIVQNGKMCSFYTIWAKKTPTSAHANLCINASCYSTRANMHRYCSMCI